MADQITTVAGLSLHVSVEIAPENVLKFLDYFKPVYDLVAAEPECLFFEVYQSADNPGKIHWVENWTKDIQWMWDVQFKKEYYKEYFEVTEPMYVKPREFKVLNRLGKAYYTVKET